MTAGRLAMSSLLFVGLLLLGAVAAIAAMFYLGFEAPRDAWARMQATLSRTPQIRERFDVFLEDGALVYLREPCEPADTEASFLLHVVPLSVGDLPVSRKGFGFDNLDFTFAENDGSLADGKCTVTAPLPRYPIDNVTTGQYDATGQLWSGTIHMPRSGEPVRHDGKVFEAGTVTTVGTHLYTLDVATVALERFAATGGAIEFIEGRWLVATPRGRLATIDRDRRVAYLESRVPMNESGFLAHGMHDDPILAQTTFRVMDILVREAPGGRHDLFAMHHFFDGWRICPRLSATTLKMVDGRVEASLAWRSVFDAKPCLEPPFLGNESGGRLLADGPNHLLVTIGHHGRDVGEAGRTPPSQDATQHLGKVLRVALATGAAEIYTLGHRNPQGLARDGDGNLWLTEHGAQGGDELNLLEPGGNYGWPEVSYGYHYPRMALKQEGRPGHHEGFVAPTFAWVPSIGISAIVANDATAFPLWRDDLLIASLWGRSRGYSLFRVRHQAQQVKYVERIEIGHQIRDLAHGPDGHLALLLDIGRVLLLRRSDVWCGKVPPRYVHAIHCAAEAGAADAAPAAAVAPDSGGESPVAEMATLSAEVREGSRLYGRHCGFCHQLEVEQYGQGPHLVGILGRRAGEASIESPALAALDKIWDEDSLQRFILNPAGFAPGTIMPSSNLTEAEARLVVGYIAERNAALTSR